MEVEVKTGKYTPGPWRVVFYDAGDREHYDHNGPCPSIWADDHDCSVLHWDGFKQKYWSSANGNQNQIEANARLIAAAPDLLEALRKITLAVAMQERDQLYPDTREGWMMAADDIEAIALDAIAKAEGRV